MNRALGLATPFATAVVLYVAAPTGAQTADPTVRVDRTGTVAGEEMVVTGDGWPAGATLIVELCGHGGLRGTVDCDVSHQRTAGAGASGRFTVELTTGTPPTPCPCVVKATDQATRIAATAPIAVAGIPTVPITEDDLPATRSIEISKIRITGGDHWMELLGAGGRRVLELTLVNTGPVAVEAPDVTVVWGSGTRPTGFVKPPETTRMEPGETQAITVALDRSAFTIGKQTAVVEVQGLAEQVTARASTTAYPWGLLAVGLVLVQLMLLWVRNRIRRRLHGAPSAVGDVPPTAIAAVAIAPLALPPAPDDDATDEEPTVLDLDEPAHHGPTVLGMPTNGSAVLQASNGNGSGPITGSVGDPIEARLQRMALQLQARHVVDRAVAVSDAIVRASTARARELDARSAERLKGALERHTEAVALLEAAKAQADETIATATAAAAAAVREAGSHEAGAHQALMEMHALHKGLAASAAVAIDDVMRDLGEQLARSSPTRQRT